MADPTRADSFAAALAQARNNEHAGWDWLYRGFAPAVFGYLLSQRAPAPEDLLGEVWLQVVRDLGRFDGDVDQFRSWLLRIAQNRLIDARRTAQRRPQVADSEIPEIVDQEADAEAAIRQEESGARLEELLAGLPDNQRAALYLRFVLDLPQKDIAAVMGISTAAVKMLQMRATRAVARQLKGGAE